MSVSVRAESAKDWQRELQGKSAEKVIAFAGAKFGEKLGFATSLGLEDMVVLDFVRKHAPKTCLFTLDTGRLPEETYQLLQKVREAWGISIHILFPDPAEVEEMVNTQGPNLFYESLEKRKLCCKVRKVNPLRKKLSSLDAWMTGLTHYQAVTRKDTPVVEWDASFSLYKFNPIVHWKKSEVSDYIREHKVPYNALHDRGYPSIGCAPCTRAIKEGEDLRAGRWWWENPEVKECGLHVKPK